MSAARWSALALAAACSAVACGGGQTRLNLFSTDWTDDGGASIDRVWQRVRATPIPPGADVVIGVATNDRQDHRAAPRGRLEVDVRASARRAPRRSPAASWSGPAAGEVFALDATTGRLVWKRPTGGLSLLGAGDDGNVTVVAFRRAGDTGSVLLAVTHDGQMVRQIETEKALGVPAVVSGLAFVPWAGQYVSVIDLANGDEMARVTLRQETSRAWTEGGTLWFGGIGYIRFDERIRDASRGRAATVSVPPRELPGMPKLIPAGHRAPARRGERGGQDARVRQAGRHRLRRVAPGRPLVRHVLPARDGLRRRTTRSSRGSTSTTPTSSAARLPTAACICATIAGS